MRRVVVLLAVGCALKPPPRPQQPYPLQSPAGIEVSVEPDGFTAWTVRAKNTRDTSVKLLWDESTFVDGNGRGYGRLIRGHTRVIDDAKSQTATVIAPNSYILEWFVPENLKDIKAESLQNNHGDRDCSGLAPVLKGVGRMLLVFETSTGRETWEEALSFDGSKPALPSNKKAAPVAPAQAAPLEQPTQ
jgi:hypothetical protein